MLGRRNTTQKTGNGNTRWRVPVHQARLGRNDTCSVFPTGNAIRPGTREREHTLPVFPVFPPALLESGDPADGSTSLTSRAGSSCCGDGPKDSAHTGTGWCFSLSPMPWQSALLASKFPTVELRALYPARGILQGDEDVAGHQAGNAPWTCTARPTENTAWSPRCWEGCAQVTTRYRLCPKTPPPGGGNPSKNRGKRRKGRMAAAVDMPSVRAVVKGHRGHPNQ